uniref:Uncharacterized protein n=1 Tax=viral metagenome TaxID=1070528 RepID=A0A6C0I436_9ZZZZ
MFVEVSIGEAVDKYSILEIKKRNISDPSKLVQVEKELEALASCKPYIEKMPSQYKWLTYINEGIWSMTDKVKSMNVLDNCQEFADISNKIFDFNQRRFRAKKMFNALDGIQEQKSYGAIICVIRVDSLETFYRRLPEINYLSLIYDYVIFDCLPDVVDRVYTIYNGSSFLRELTNVEYKSIIHYTLSQISLDSQDTRNIFEFSPIHYISGGMLGDFIQGLSVIAERFYAEGRQGILYAAEEQHGHGCFNFRHGLEGTYKDTYEMISQQVWCKEYKMYDNSMPLSFVNLNSWRYDNDSLLYKTNWHAIYKVYYGVEWGKHQWITLTENMLQDSENHLCRNKVLINIAPYRFSPFINYELLISTYGKDSLIFIAHNKRDYDVFKENTGLDITYYSPTSFTDLCIALSSSSLFLGGLSAPLTVGHALSIKRSICLSNTSDDAHNVNNPYWEDCIDNHFLF